MLANHFLIKFLAVSFHYCLLLSVVVDEGLLLTCRVIKSLVRQLEYVIDLSDVDVVICDTLVCSESRKMLRANLINNEL